MQRQRLETAIKNKLYGWDIRDMVNVIPYLGDESLKVIEIANWIVVDGFRIQNKPCNPKITSFVFLCYNIRESLEGKTK